MSLGAVVGRTAISSARAPRLVFAYDSSIYSNAHLLQTSQTAPATEAKGEEDEDEDMDDGSADTPEAMQRKKQKAIAKAAKKAAKNRPDKDRLSKLSSISGSKSKPPGGSMRKKRKSQ